MSSISRKLTEQSCLDLFSSLVVASLEVSATDDPRRAMGCHLRQNYTGAMISYTTSDINIRHLGTYIRHPGTYI